MRLQPTESSELTSHQANLAADRSARQSHEDALAQCITDVLLATGTSSPPQQLLEHVKRPGWALRELVPLALTSLYLWNMLAGRRPVRVPCVPTSPAVPVAACGTIL